MVLYGLRLDGLGDGRRGVDLLTVSHSLLYVEPLLFVGALLIATLAGFLTSDNGDFTGISCLAFLVILALCSWGAWAIAN